MPGLNHRSGHLLLLCIRRDLRILAIASSTSLLLAAIGVQDIGKHCAVTHYGQAVQRPDLLAIVNRPAERSR